MNGGINRNTLIEVHFARDYWAIGTYCTPEVFTQEAFSSNHIRFLKLWNTSQMEFHLFPSIPLQHCFRHRPTGAFRYNSEINTSSKPTLDHPHTHFGSETHASNCIHHWSFPACTLSSPTTLLGAWILKS